MNRRLLLSFLLLVSPWAVPLSVAAGALDPTFSGDGRARVAFDLVGPNSGDDKLYGLARDPNTGKLLLCGSAQSPSGHSLAIARLHFTGGLDSTFSGNGKFELTFGDANSRLEEIAVDGLGRTLVAGFRDYPSSDADYIALRLLDGGTLDPTFGFGGLSLIEFNLGPGSQDDDYGRALTIQAGRLVVAGEVEVSEIGESLPGLARLDVALIFADGFESGAVGLWSSSAMP